jgi:hypothetical protein
MCLIISHNHLLESVFLDAKEIKKKIILFPLAVGGDM